MRPCGATRAGTQAPPLPISIIFFHAILHKRNTICTQSAQTTSTAHAQSSQNGINRLRAICPNETVGAAPVCPPERPRSGVSIPKIHALCAGNLTTNALLWDDTGGQTGTALTNLHQTMRCAITSSHCTFDSPRQSHGVFIPHRIVHSIAHANHAVCPYPIGVILSIAQGWQVQRSLPWVKVQARRLPPWGLYFFSSHTLTTRSE